MKTTYEVADKETARYVTDVAYEIHPSLAEHGVTLAVLFAGPELKHRGFPAAATVRITRVADRLAGMPDAVITIDRARWDGLDDAGRRALVDHEAAHLVVDVRDGEVQYDEAGRPRLKMRRHDCEIGFFFDVIERHGKDACESKQYLELSRKMTQLAFPWG